MKSTSTLFQSNSLRIPDELERLELLVPEVAHTTSRDLQAYALAYIDHYQGDVLQLEHEREFLYAALTEAWQQAKYAIVIRLVAGLAHIVSRLNNLTEAEHILYLGIEASRHTQDKQHLAYFLNRLGSLLFSCGKYQQGYRIWRASFQLAESSDFSLFLWEPISSFAHIADMLGSSTAAQRFVDICRTDDPDTFAVVIFIRGFYSRLMNDPDNAYKDLSCSLRLLSHQTSTTPQSPRQLLTLVVQAELARVQENYARAQEYTETALSLAQLFSDRYTVATLLIDQGLYTYRMGQFADTHTTFLRLRDLALQMEAPHPYKLSCLLEQWLASVSLESRNNLRECENPPFLSTASTEHYEPLSKREVEVLQLVAEGLSNREIAERLVITVGTVKKHLEHIYGKVDAHSRTGAVARGRILKVFA